MRWTSAISTDGDALKAAAEAVVRIRHGLQGAEPDLVVAFVSPHHDAEYPALVHALNSAFDDALLIGCSGGGVIGDGEEVERRPALSLTAAVLPGVHLHPFHIEPDELPERPAALDVWTSLLDVDPDDAPHFVLMSDPYSARSDALLGSLDTAFPTAHKVGGLASGGRGPRANALFLGNRVFRSGTVGLALTGNVDVDAVVSQGCKPVGHPMIVTRADDNLVLELDGQEPVEVLQELYDHLDERDRELFRTALFLGVEMQDTIEHQAGQFLIRNLLGAQEETGGIYVGEILRPWQVVQFHLRDARTSDADLRAVLASYQQRATAAPAGALLFTCLGRGQGLYGHPNHDSATFREHVGAVPLGGFFCNGEFGPVQGATYLHGYSSAFGLFRPRE